MDVPTAEYDSPFPECRVLSGWDVAGMVRFDISRKRAALLAMRIDEDVDDHPSDEHYHFILSMDRRAYEELADGVGQIVGRDEIGAKQIVVDPDPAISVTVCLNQSQLEDLAEGSRAGLKQGDSDDAYAVQVSTSKSSAQMLVQQLIAAVKGADDPLDHVDTEGVA